VDAINLRSLCTVLRVSLPTKPYFYRFIDSEKPMTGVCVLLDCDV
jgi:hypothetical protein